MTPPTSIWFPFLRNSKGAADGMWTLVVVAFLLCVAVIGCAIFDIQTGEAMTAALTLFGSCSAVYWGRKSTDSKAFLPHAAVVATAVIATPSPAVSERHPAAAP